MNKLVLLSSAVLLAATGCTSSDTGYTVTGTCEGAQDGDTLYICEMRNIFTLIPEDTAVVKDGKFEFKGTTEGAKLRIIAGNFPNVAAIVLENYPITVDIYADQSVPSNVNGGPSWDLYNKFIYDNPYREELEAAYEMGEHEGVGDEMEPSEEELRNRATVDSLAELSNEWEYEFVMNTIPSAFADMMLELNQWTPEQVNSLMDKMSGYEEKYPVYKAYEEFRQSIKKVDVGHSYVDFEIPTETGETVKLSDFVGKSKLLLVDFWASWCGPCKMEMPNVVNAYEKYHERGFEVLGIALDDDTAAWASAVSELGMKWPQVIDAEGVSAETYGIRSIPSNVLIDETGTIIRKNLRGEKDYKVLEELLK